MISWGATDVQALSLGLGEEWEKVKTAYAMANRVLGDIVKVRSLLAEWQPALCEVP